MGNEHPYRDRNLHRSRRRGAFTLIELLVVISLIALLLAILMPALHRAKRQAMSVVCQSNLKQLGLTFSLYTGDNHGYFHREDSTDWRANWIPAMRAYYSQEPEIRVCPTTTPAPATASVRHNIVSRNKEPAATGLRCGTRPASGQKGSRSPWGDRFIAHSIICTHAGESARRARRPRGTP